MINTAAGVHIPFLDKVEEKYTISENNIRFNISFEKYSIEETKILVIAWDTFLTKNPGKCTNVFIDNKDIYDVVEELKKIGMYLAKAIQD